MTKKHIINVKPFKNKEDLNLFLEELSKTKNGARDVLIAKIGLVSVLRISDILNLKIHDVLNKTSTTIVEKKTKKKRTIYFNNIIVDIINYMNTIEYNDAQEYLFKAQRDSNKHLDEHQYYKILKKVADNINFDFVCTHTLRKTFARFYYVENKDISTLMKILNHSSQQITLKYIDITYDEIKQSLLTFNPF